LHENQASCFSKRRLMFVNSTSIYAVLFSSLRLLLNKDYFITPASIYAVLFSSLHLLFIQYSFHYSSFYFYNFLFINPASISVKSDC